MDKLKNIVLNNFDTQDKVIKHNFDKFKEVETCTLNEFEINDEIIDKLNEMKNLKMLILNHCVFKNQKKLENNTENLIITYGKNVKFENIKNAEKIKQLKITKLGNIDINELKVFENLEELSIYECEIKNFEKIKSFPKLRTLKLDGSQIDDKEILKEMKNRINIQYKKTYHIGF